MKRNFTFLLLCLLVFPAFAQLNVSYVGNLSYDVPASDIWGYAAPDQTEYALLGLQNGVSIISLADPANPIEADFVPGASSIWRDIKTWGNFAYAINESANGLAVINMSTLPDSVTSYNWTPDLPGLGTLSTCHNIWIDEFGYAYIVGCNLNNGGAIILNVDTDDGTPEFVAAMPAIYSHDIFVRNNLAYNSEIYLGEFAIYDVSDKDNIQNLGSQTTPYQFTHNTWLSDDGNTLFTTDETADAPIGSYDVSDPGNIVELDQFRPSETVGSGVIPHNVHVLNDWIIISYYTDGCIIVDGSQPDNLIEVGNFDTYFEPGTGFSGAWGAYPYLPSGLILLGDIENGLYVLEPNYVRAGYLEGTITDATNNDLINGALIEILGTTTFEESNFTGSYKTGIATAGTYDIKVSKPGFQDAIQSVPLQNDSTTTLDVALEPLPSFPLNGIVVDANTGEGIPGAKVNISNETFSFDVEAAADGVFSLAAAFQGGYKMYAGVWGYQTAVVEDFILDENTGNVIIEIEPGYADPFQLDLGWTITDDANSGAFERVVPISLFVPGPDYSITPETDIVDDIGNQCYVTENGTDLFSNTLSGGSTTISSPGMDLSNYNEPMLSYNTFVFSVDISNPNGATTGAGNIEVRLLNDFDSPTIGTHESDNIFTTAPVWKYSEISIHDFIGATVDSLVNLQLEFEASSGEFEISEMGVDDIQVWDANPTGTSNPLTTLEFRAMPNPTLDVFNISFALEDWAPDTELSVFNALGQQVHQVILSDSVGNYTFGEDLQPGAYFAHITQNGQQTKTILLLKK